MTDSADTTGSSEPSTPTREQALDELTKREVTINGYSSAVAALEIGIGIQMLKFEARLFVLDADNHGVSMELADHFEDLKEVEEDAQPITAELWRTVRSAQILMEDTLRELYTFEPGLLIRASQLDDAIRDLRTTTSRIDEFERQHRQALADYFAFTEMGSKEVDQRRHELHTTCFKTTHMASTVVDGHLTYLDYLRNPGSKRVEQLVRRIFGDDVEIEHLAGGAAMVSIDLSGSSPSRFIRDVIGGL